MSVVKLGKADYDYFKSYERKFIQISRDNAILIHLFHKDSDHSFEDIWLHDLKGVYETDVNILKDSAKQFVDQFEGHWCRAFLQALRDECDKRIAEDLEKCKKYTKVKPDESL